MAVDISITDAQYNQLVSVANALMTKLDAIKPVLKAAMQQDAGKAKIKRFVQNNPTQARLLIKTNQLANFLDDFRQEVGW